MKINFSFCILLFLFLASGCMNEEVIEPVVEKETFQRHENSNFNYTNVNVKHIQVIGERLFYSNSTNPGFIDRSGEVNQLCCLIHNNNDMKQSFSEKFIVGTYVNLTGFSVYKTDRSGSGNINFSLLDIHQNNNTSVPFQSYGRNYALNDELLLATVSEDYSHSIYIYDVERHTNFVGMPKDKEGVIRVDFSRFSNPEAQHYSSAWNVDAFKDGWIVTARLNNPYNNGTYFVRKDGTVEKLDIMVDNNPFAYENHAVMDNGQLFMMANRKLFVSRTGELKDLQPMADTGNVLKIQSVGNRLVIYHPVFHVFHEVEGVLHEDAEEWNLRRLDDTNLSFSSINDIVAFGDKVYVATSIGLFTKSLDGFWDSYEESDNTVNINRTDDAVG